MSYKALANVVGSDFIVRQGDIIPDGLFNTLPDFQKSRFQKVAKTVKPAITEIKEISISPVDGIKVKLEPIAGNTEQLTDDKLAQENSPDNIIVEANTGNTEMPWPVAPPDPEGHVTDNPDRQYLNKSNKSDKAGKSNKGGK